VLSNVAKNRGMDLGTINRKNLIGIDLLTRKSKGCINCQKLGSLEWNA
jgi:hypothetical protein